MSTANDLVAAAAEAQEPMEPDAIVERGAWTPQTIRDVEWALECIAESEAEVAEIDGQLADLIARATAKRDILAGRAQRRIDYMKGRVAEFAVANRADLLVGKAKSRNFLSGKVGFRKRGGKLRVDDKEALAAWLSTQDPSMFRIRLEPEMAVLQKQFQTDGVIPPGCTFESERDEVYVEAAPLPTLSPPAKELP
jgi:phage host-nuclease inhibitor protein Gam